MLGFQISKAEMRLAAARCLRRGKGNKMMEEDVTKKNQSKENEFWAYHL